MHLDFAKNPVSAGMFSHSKIADISFSNKHNAEKRYLDFSTEHMDKHGWSFGDKIEIFAHVRNNEHYIIIKRLHEFPEGYKTRTDRICGTIGMQNYSTYGISTRKKLNSLFKTTKTHYRDKYKFVGCETETGHYIYKFVE